MAPANLAGYRRLVTIFTPFNAFHQASSWDIAVRYATTFAEVFSDELISVLVGFRALFIGAQSAEELPEIVARTLSTLSKPGSVLPEASAHLVWSSDSLAHRYGLIRVLLNSAHRSLPATSHESLSASSRELVGDITIGFGSYLEPLMTSLSPHVWGMTAARAGGVIVLCYGQPVPGRRELSADLVSLSADAKPVSPLTIGPIPSSAFREAVNWWVNQLDLVFSHLTEPANYSSSGAFSPAQALERLVTFEQICRSVQTIATTDDPHAKRLALFFVLDSLEGLNGKLRHDEATKLTRAQALLSKLRQKIPTAIHSILLPRAEAAIEALGAVQTGFFDQTRVKDGRLWRVDKKGQGAFVDLDVAASEWLRVLRNSQHGYQKPNPHQRSLLAAHTGHFPPRLPDLAWLELLNILAHPEILKAQKRHQRPTPKT